MSKASDVLTGLKTQLEADTYLKTVIKRVFLGMRETITLFPCILIEIMSVEESNSNWPIQDITLNLALIVYKKITDADNQLSDMVDLTNAVKKAIGLDHTIGGKAIQTKIVEEHHEFIDYPTRSAALAVNVYFRQTMNVRT